MNTREDLFNDTERDEALLQHFFTEHREAIEDDGFTERVLAATGADSRLRRWSMVLNVAAVVAAVVALVVAFGDSDVFGSFGAAMEWVMATVQQVVVAVRALDADTVLVHVLLFLHRLPALLPTAEQATTLAFAMILLFGVTVDRLQRIRI